MASLDDTIRPPGSPDQSRTPVIPEHEVLRHIGSGAFGDVWLARSVTRQYRAVKLIYRNAFESSRPYDKEYTGVFKFEPVSRSHEGFVDVLQVGRNDEAGYFYYVMELGDDQITGQAINPDTYRGKTLHSEIETRGKLPFAECVQLGLSLSAALSCLHEKGLIHRDIKHKNIIFVDGVPKLADIGLVTGVDEAKSFVGTEGYIPPEGPGTPLADIYSLGKVLYEASTGKDRMDFPELPTDLGETADGENFLKLNEVLLKACENDPAKRYQAAKQMRDDLERLVKGLPLESVRPTLNNLPAQLTSFVGRETEITEVRKLLKTTRLLTLTGIGGCGKTRLALEVAGGLAGEFPDGVWLVELAALSDPALVTQAVASVLGVREEPNRPLLSTLSDYLRSKQTLLLLDNCEHLIQACAEFAESLLRACPNVRILATSREGLGIGGEAIRHVPSLSTPAPDSLPPLEQFTGYEAVRLFVERAVEKQLDFAVTTANAKAVAQICKRLDGIPLCIELAAARLNMLSAEQIAVRLDDLFRLLTGGSRTALPRQQTLEATMDWSYELLSEAEQKLLQCLSVFAGGFTLEAAEAVYEGYGLELLAHLVDKSMAVAEKQGGEVRYRMLETIRQYGRNKLKESGKSEAARARHRDFFLKLAEQAETKLEGANQVEWLNRLETEQDNLRMALEWSVTDTGNSELALRLASALGQFWLERDHVSEGRRWLEASIKEAVSSSLAARAKVFFWAGALAMRLGDFAGARSSYERGLAIFRGLNDKAGIARSLCRLGWVALNTDNLTSARSLIEESLVIARECGDKATIAEALFSSGNLAHFQTDNVVAQSRFHEALEIQRELGNKSGAANVYRHLAWEAASIGEFALARSLFEQARVLHQELNDKAGIALAFIDLAGVAVSQGDYEGARTMLEDALRLGHELGRKRMIAHGLDQLGDVAFAQSDYLTARSLLEKSQTLLRETDDNWSLAFRFLGLGRVARKQGDLASAHAYLGNSLLTARAIGHKWCVGHALLALGELAKDGGDYSTAHSFSEQSLVIYRELDSKHCIAESLGKLSEIAKLQGDVERAITLGKESLSLYRDVGAKPDIAPSLDRLAGVYEAQGQAERSAKLFGAAEALREAIGAVIHPCDREEYDENVAPVRTALSEKSFAAAWAAGKAMTIEEAVAYALV